MRLHIDQILDKNIYSAIQTAYQTYERDRKPIEYITGTVEFFGQQFMVNQHTLIPRAETEYMIQAVSEYCQILSSNSATTVLFDIGTGCGVLGISVLLQNSDTFSQAFFTDYSSETLEVAMQNIQTLLRSASLQLEVLKADLLDFIPHYSFSHQHIVLVANLPYIPEESFEHGVGEEVKKREPKMAFVGGDDGLDWYRKMLDQLIDFQQKGHIGSHTMFLEMMTRRVEKLREAYDQYRDFIEIKTFHFNIRIVQVISKQ